MVFPIYTAEDCNISFLQCYLELAEAVKDKLSAIDPYFTKLGEAMVTWIEAWAELNHPNSSKVGGSLSSAQGPQALNGPAKPPVPPVKKT